MEGGRHVRAFAHDGLNPDNPRARLVLPDQAMVPPRHGYARGSVERDLGDRIGRAPA